MPEQKSEKEESTITSSTLFLATCFFLSLSFTFYPSLSLSRSPNIENNEAVSVSGTKLLTKRPSYFLASYGSSEHEGNSGENWVDASASPPPSFPRAGGWKEEVGGENEGPREM